jgi:hypothetical protein
MILTETVVQMILGNGLSLKLAGELGFQQQWILKLAKANKKNGPLTTAKAIQVIREYAGLLDSEILVEETKEPAKNS